MIKAVLFDMDGVLIDAKGWHYEALNKALSIFGMSISLDAHLSTFDGLPTRNKLEILTRTRGFPRRLHDFTNSLKQQFTLEISHQRCKPQFNHQVALSKLRRDGYRLAVCSNSVRATVETMMRLSNLEGYLELLVSNEDVLIPKPAPDIYLHAMQHFQARPDECLILEDNEHGIQAAKASGGHLLEIGLPSDVSYERIKERIAQLDRVH